LEFPEECLDIVNFFLLLVEKNKNTVLSPFYEIFFILKKFFYSSLLVLILVIKEKILYYNMKFDLFFPLFYEIDLFEDYLIFNNGEIFSRKTNKFLKAKINNKGYACVVLWNENGKCDVQISRLVGDYFVENENNKEFIDHIDRNPLNNHYSNLRWCSPYENNLNRNKNKNNKSGFIGVYLDNKNNRWQAGFRKDGKRIMKCFPFQEGNEIDKEIKFREACKWRQEQTDNNYDQKYFNGNK
jgi:hypothetical protein